MRRLKGTEGQCRPIQAFPRSRLNKSANQQINLFPTHMGSGELKHIHQAFDTYWIAPIDPYIDKLHLVAVHFSPLKNQ